MAQWYLEWYCTLQMQAGLGGLNTYLCSFVSMSNGIFLKPFSFIRYPSYYQVISEFESSDSMFQLWKWVCNQTGQMNTSFCWKPFKLFMGKIHSKCTNRQDYNENKWLTEWAADFPIRVVTQQNQSRTQLKYNRHKHKVSTWGPWWLSGTV